MNAPTPASQRNRGVLKVALIVCACAFLFGFAMVPIYRIACEHVFGIKLAEGAASEAKVSAFVEDDSRTIRVQFVASVNSKLPWAFQPEAPSIDVHPGKLMEAWFDATNHSKEAIVGNAVPSIAPNTASLYFNKTECFCFTEQLLNPGESRRMPVRFVVDPKLPKEITELTLSYTFYENTVATQRVAETGSPLPAG
jgi:cytochrome c oxidase assembly protein subunit 11